MTNHDKVPGTAPGGSMVQNMEAQERPKIPPDEITKLLATRWICCYMLYDYNLSHADNCFFNNDYDREARAVEKATAVVKEGQSLSDCLTQAYNEVLSEEIEKLTAHICGDHMSRAEFELQLAEMVAEYKKLPGYGQEEEK